MGTLLEEYSFKTRSKETVFLSIHLGRKNRMWVHMTIVTVADLPNKPAYWSNIAFSKSSFKKIIQNARNYMTEIERKESPSHLQIYYIGYGRDGNITFRGDEKRIELEVWHQGNLVNRISTTYENWRDILDYIYFKKILNRLERCK